MGIAEYTEVFRKGGWIDLKGEEVQASEILDMGFERWAEGKNDRLRLKNGTVEGDLDFSRVASSPEIMFEDVTLDLLLLARARLDTLSIKRGECAGIEGAGLQTLGGVDLNTKFSGRVRLVVAGIGGDLNCNGASFDRSEEHAEKGYSALIFDNARIDGSVVLKNISSTAQISAWRARVGGAFLFSRDAGTNTKCCGNLILRDAGIGENCDLDRADIGGSLRLQRARIGGDLTLRHGTKVGGKTTLIGTTLGGLSVGKVKPPSLQGKLRMDHISVGRVRGATVDWLAGFLERNSITTSQPWEEASSALTRSGRPQDARKLAIRGERFRTSKLKLWRRPWRWILNATVGYGYRPARSLIPSAAIVVLSYLLFVWKVTFDKGDGPSSGEFFYSLDAFLPIDLGYFSTWTPQSTFGTTIASGEAIFGWVLTALLLGAVTGLLRNK